MRKLCTRCEYFSNYAKKIDFALNKLRCQSSSSRDEPIDDNIAPLDVFGNAQEASTLSQEYPRTDSRPKPSDRRTNGRASRERDESSHQSISSSLAEDVKPLLDHALQMQDLMALTSALRSMTFHCSADTCGLSKSMKDTAPETVIAHAAETRRNYLVVIDSLTCINILFAEIERDESLSTTGSEPRSQSRRNLLVDMFRLALSSLTILIQDMKDLMSGSADDMKSKSILTTLLDSSFRVLGYRWLSRDDCAVLCMANISAFYLFVTVVENDGGSSLSKVADMLLRRLSSNAVGSSAVEASSCSSNRSINDYADKITSSSALTEYHLMKAVLCVFGDEISASTIEDKAGSCTFTNVYPSTCIWLCKHESFNHRICGIQLIDAWLDCWSSIVKCVERENQELITTIGEIMLSMMRSLLSCWIYPIQIVSRLVPDVYQRLIKEASALFQLQGATEISIADSWKTWINEAATIGSSVHRCRYQALSHLIQGAGIHAILRSQPSLLEDLLSIISHRDVASSAGNLIVAIVKSCLSDQIASAASRNRNWSKLIAQTLCSSSRKARLHLADYVIPALLKLDPYHCASKIMAEIRNFGHGIDRDLLLWGFVRITLQLRLQGSATCSELASISSGEIGLTRDEIAAACISGDDDLRLAALQVLVASNRPKSPMPALDFEVFSQVIKYSFKTSLAEHRQKVSSAISSMILRLPVGNAEQAIGLILRECSLGLLPETNDEREVMALDVLRSLIESPTFDKLKLGEKIYHSSLGLLLLSKALFSAWDRSRAVAWDIIANIPSPLPGFESVELASMLLTMGAVFLENPNQRYCESGAMLLKLLVQRYVVDLGWEILVSEDDHLTMQPPSQTMHGDNSKAVIRFMDSLLELLERKARRFAASIQLPMVNEDESLANSSYLDGSVDIQLVHGYLMALAFSWEIHLNSSQHPTRVDGNVSHLPLLKRSLLIVTSCFSSAMMIVGESDNQQTESIDTATAALSSKGPINAATMTASYVNANSLMGANMRHQTKSKRTSDMEDTNDEENNNPEIASCQRKVIAAWQMIKESASLLSYLVKCSCIRSDQARLMDVDAMILTGNVLFDALGRLKHMGAIAEVQSAFQSISSSFLNSSDREIRELPEHWLHRLLSKLDCGRLRDTSGKSQVFILRRSAGLASSFQSLLRADASCKGSGQGFLSTCIDSLLSVIKPAVTRDIDSSNNNQWQLAVHALNVLRMLMLDAVFSSNNNSEYNHHLAETLSLAIHGFQSSAWAIRNSSMMVYAAAATKAIGSSDKNEKGGLSTKALSFSHFFERYPSLFSLFLEQLLASQDSSSSTESMALYPILTLLGKLRVSAVSEDVDGAEEMMKGMFREGCSFLSALRKLLGHKSMLIRSAAAHAMLPLLAVMQYPQLIDYMLRPMLEGQPVAANELHGRLLALVNVVKLLIQSAQIDSASGSASYISESARSLIKESCERLCSHLPSINEETRLLVNCASVQLAWLKFLQTSRQLLKIVRDLDQNTEDCLSQLKERVHNRIVICRSKPRSLLPDEATLFTEVVEASFAYLDRKVEVDVLHLHDLCADHPVVEVRIAYYQGLRLHLDEGCKAFASRMESGLFLSILKTEKNNSAREYLLLLIHKMLKHKLFASSLEIFDLMQGLFRVCLDDSATMPTTLASSQQVRNSSISAIAIQVSMICHYYLSLTSNLHLQSILGTRKLCAARLDFNRKDRC
jgi:hypothetical protein